MEYELIQKKIKKKQSKKRFQHTLGVAYTSACLAFVYDVDIEKAKLAGILHDFAKQLSDDKMLSLCKKNGIEVSEIERKSPYLLHGKVGAMLAKNKFDIEDEDIINAIVNHTTGRANMSMLEKIVFVADYIEPNRNSAPQLGILRKMAFEDIDRTIVMITQNTLSYLDEKGMPIDEKTLQTYEYYKEKIN